MEFDFTQISRILKTVLDGAALKIDEAESDLLGPKWNLARQGYNW